jgi:diguanylate cyclase (GGDEF)-like protein/PAS domain S-box-containing protein
MTRWIALVVTAVAAAALIIASVVLDGERAAVWCRAAIGFGAGATAIIGAIVHRPTRPVPWIVFGVGLGLLGVAELVRGFAVLDGDTAYPGAAEAVGALAYPSLIAATIGLTSTNRRARDLLAGSEPMIYSIAVTALVWVAATGPFYDGDEMPMNPEAWVWLFPLLDGMLALLAVRRIGRDQRPERRFEVLALGFLLLGAGHAAVGWAAYDSRLDDGGWVLLAPLVGVAVLAVSFAWTMGQRALDTHDAARVHWTQIFGLLFAALVPLGALVLMLATGLASRSSSYVVAIATVAVIVLALVRMWRLVDEVRTLSEQRGRDRLAAMVEHSSDVVMLADPSGRVSYASPGLRPMLGHDPESWAGRHLVDVIVPDERAEAMRSIERAIEQGEGGTVEFEATLAHLDGQQRKATIVIANLVGGVALDGIVATFRDVTEQRNLERQLSHRAFHDELTGLANRALFLDRMDHALRIARPEIDPVVVLFVDLDDFKRINDELGHAVGDQVLKQIADRIRRAAGTGDTAARLGGDEFALLLEDRGGIDRAIDVAERLLDSLREPLPAAGEDVAVLASVGVAVASPGMSTTSLLRDADIAMYEAKRAGKGQIRIFDPAMRLHATKHLEYRSDLARAIELDQLRMVFMPIVDLSNGQVVGAEALVRWQHPEHGDVPASEFLPIAERSGLIVPIGNWALRAACAEAANWRAGLLLALNVSGVQLRQPDFVERTVALIDELHVDPSVVVLEVTEPTLLDEGERAAEAVARLREEGFRFALDDFGTGYCSLTSLQRNAVDIVKIDRGAVAEFGNDPRGVTLARTILQMATSLGIATVAEGIEDAAQLRELRAQGCTMGQGYLLSAPVESADLRARFGHPEMAASPHPVR